MKQLDRRLLTAASLLTLILIAFSTGCRHGDYSQARLDHRGNSLSWTVSQFEQSEASRPRKLAWTFDEFGRIAAEDARQLDRNWRGLQSIIESDARRFEQRQPLYRKVILDVLDGHPEAIEKTAIDLFY